MVGHYTKFHIRGIDFYRLLSDTYCLMLLFIDTKWKDTNLAKKNLLIF
jgi:hypothetical protein